MVREAIQGILNKELAKKKHEYIKIKWEKARLEQLLKEMKEKNQSAV